MYSICLLHFECEFNVNIQRRVREHNPHFQTELDEEEKEYNCKNKHKGTLRNVTVNELNVEAR